MAATPGARPGRRPGEITVHVRYEIIHVDPGHWCETCALPSGLRITVAMVFGANPLSVATLARCADCGAHRWER